MSTFLRIDINLFAAGYLSIVFYLAYRRLDHKDAFNRLFFVGCATVLTLTLVEALTCVLNKQPAPVWRVLATVLHQFLFILPPLLTYYWYLFACALTGDGNIQKLKPRWPFFIPIGIVVVLTVLSPFYHFIYFVDEAGVYHRGPLFPVELVISYSYLLLGFIQLIIRRKKMIRMDFIFLTLFCLMPMIGGLIQGLIYGVLLMWSSSACALTILYLYLQERMIQTDYLTGAWTRSTFEYHVDQRLKNEQREPFGVIYVDIDNLKFINDHFGHNEGDVAIKAAISIIRDVLRPSDVIARLGGDEFVVLLNLTCHKALQAVVKRIQTSVGSYNATSNKPYPLSLSLGADLVSAESGESVDAIISRVDLLMYNNKRRKKNLCDDADALAQDNPDSAEETPPISPT